MPGLEWIMGFFPDQTVEGQHWVDANIAVWHIAGLTCQISLNTTQIPETMGSVHQKKLSHVKTQATFPKQQI